MIYDRLRLLGVIDIDDADSPEQKAPTPYANAPLMQAIREGHNRLGTSMLSKYLSGLRNSADRFPMGLGWTSFCAGTEMVARVHDFNMLYWQDEYAIGMVNRTLVAAEIGKTQQRFIVAQHDHPQMQLLEDICEIADTCCSRSAKTGKVERVQMGAKAFISGFSCKSRSKRNANKKQNINCIQNHDDSGTSVTYWSSSKHLFSDEYEYQLAVLENTTGIDEKGDNGKSDAEAILEDFRKHEWTAATIIVEAHKHKSWCFRTRHLLRRTCPVVALRRGKHMSHVAYLYM